MVGGGDDGAQGGDRAADPVLGALRAWRDLLALGTAAMDIAAASGEFDKLAYPFGLYAEPFLRTAAFFGDLGRTGLDAAAEAGGFAKTAAAGAAMAQDLSPILAEVYLVAARSALRYWRRLAATGAAHQSTFVHMLGARLGGPGLTDEEQRRVCDDIRAYLREIGEDALREARVFQSELDGLAAAAAEAVDKSGATAYRRRWKAKK